MTIGNPSHHRANLPPQEPDTTGQVLAALAAVQPPPAFELRVLQAVLQEAVQQQESCSTSATTRVLRILFRAPWLASSFAAATMLAVFALVFSTSHPVGTRTPQTPLTAKFAENPPPHAPRAVHPTVIRVPHGATPRRMHLSRTFEASATSVSSPALSNRLAPPMPLTEEEKLLVQLARNLIARPAAVPGTSAGLDRMLTPAELQADLPGALSREGRPVQSIDTLPSHFPGVPNFPLPLTAWNLPAPAWPPIPSALPQVRLATP